jgi:hypothetical protein
MNNDPLIVYWSSTLSLVEVYRSLHKQKSKTRIQPVNLLQCPAFQNGMDNLFMLTLTKDESYEWNVEWDLTKGLNKTLDIPRTRYQHFENSDYFNLPYALNLFCEESLQMQATAPWFHKSTFQEKGTTVGGIYDIGKWYRPIIMDVCVWGNSGKIDFKANEPLYYIKFLTDRPVKMVRYNNTPELELFATTLINDPNRSIGKRFGTLEKRYEIFAQSPIRQAIIEEIKANLVSEDIASPSV